MTNDPGLLNIRYETLSGAQNDLAAAYEAAQSAIEELKTKLAGSLDQWTGQAREAYNEVQAEWDKSFVHMAAVLREAHVHLGTANETYQAVERQNTSIWQG